MKKSVLNWEILAIYLGPIGNCTKAAWWPYKSVPTQTPFAIGATGYNYIRPRTRGFGGLAVITSR